MRNLFAPTSLLAMALGLARIGQAKRTGQGAPGVYLGRSKASPPAQNKPTGKLRTADGRHRYVLKVRP